MQRLSLSIFFSLWSAAELISATNSPTAAPYWTRSAAVSPLSSRTGAATAWTGKELLVWGGGTSQQRLNQTFGDGACFDPFLDRWTSITAVGAPSSRMAALSFWTGKELWVIGGYSYVHSTNFVESTVSYHDGARYDPILDRWRPIADVAEIFGFPIWTGKQIILWSGYPTPRGRKYDPEKDTWSTISLQNSPPLTETFPVWAGAEMIIWGKTNGFPSEIGGAYNPETDTWRTITVARDVASSRGSQTAVWTGSEIIVWNTRDPADPNYRAATWRYDMSMDRWTKSTTTNLELGGYGPPTSVWTGSEMIVWFGYFAWNATDAGGRYDPIKDIWTPIPKMGAPSARRPGAMFWTGSEVIIWGGAEDPAVPYFKDCWLYTPEAPKASIWPRENGEIEIEWKYPFPGYVLERSSDLKANSFERLELEPSHVRTNWQTVIPKGGGGFFRLRKD